MSFKLILLLKLLKKMNNNPLELDFSLNLSTNNLIQNLKNQKNF